MMPYAKPQITQTRVCLPAHMAELEASAVDFPTAALAGVYSIGHAETYDLGIRGVGDLCGLCFPYWDVTEQAFSRRFVRVKPDAHVTDRKYLQPVAERPRLYFIAGTTRAALVDVEVPVYIVEGEKKALALLRALQALHLPGLVIGIGGVWAWRRSDKELKSDGKLDKGRSRPIEDLDLVCWERRRTFLLFDSDVELNFRVAGAETALAEELRRRGGQIFVGRVPSLDQAKTGIDDLLAARGPEALRDLFSEAHAFDGHPVPRRVHLSEIEDASLGRRRLAIDFMVSAVGDTFLLPQTVQLQCVDAPPKEGKAKLRLVKAGQSREDADRSDGTCGHQNQDGGLWQIEINNPEILIELTKTPSHLLHRRLQTLATALCPCARVADIVSRQPVSSFLASPRSRRLRSTFSGGSLEVRDERGRPYREKVLYLLGRLNTSSRYFRGIGIAIPNPKTQEATAFLWKLQPMAEDHEVFNMTADLAARFRVLQAETGGAQTAMHRIARVLTDELTQIYGEHRQRALLGKLLVYHSALQFSFDGERLRRGWLEMLEIGDTGQGKTQQVERIMEATGLGEAVDGVSTTRTGLAYAFLKFNETWFLVWGKYPLSDGRLLVIDEAQNLAEEDFDKIRKGRSNGVIDASGIRSGEHPTRTRLILACNPRYHGVVDDELFGIDLVRQTFKDEDIRRFDFAIISAGSDDKAQINEPRPPVSQSQREIPDDLLAASIRWAWSRRPEHVVFAQDATQSVYQAAQMLAARYGAAREIPLALESDVRHKVARLAVAAAALLHSTDSDHEQIVVRTEHVVAVVQFLLDIYDHSNCAFGLYADFRRAEADLPDGEYDRLWSHLRTTAVEGSTLLTEDDIATLLRAFVSHAGIVGRDDLAAELGKTKEWVSKIVRILKAERLIRVNRGRAGGYRATPKFSKFLKLAITKKDLEA